MDTLGENSTKFGFRKDLLMGHCYVKTEEHKPRNWKHENPQKVNMVVFNENSITGGVPQRYSNGPLLYKIEQCAQKMQLWICDIEQWKSPKMIEEIIVLDGNMVNIGASQVSSNGSFLNNSKHCPELLVVTLTHEIFQNEKNYCFGWKRYQTFRRGLLMVHLCPYLLHISS